MTASERAFVLAQIEVAMRIAKLLMAVERLKALKVAA